MSAAPCDARDDRSSSLSWNEIDCFLRPQYLICSDHSEGYGDILVFLYSLYKASGLDRLFVGPEQRYFTFADQIVSPVLSVRFDRIYPAGRDDLLARITNALAHGPVILPVNLRLLPYSTCYQKIDRAHYFIVTARDAAGRRVIIHDNLHVQSDNRSTEYAQHSLDEAVLERVASLYWDTHVDQPRPNPHGESRYWLLQISRVDGAERPAAHSREDASRTIVREYLRRGDAIAHASADHHVDQRWLATLERLQGGDRATLNLAVRGYLADVNASAVHYDLLVAAIARVAGEDSALANHLREYKQLTGITRTKHLVQIVAGTKMEWELARAELRSQTSALEAHLAASARNAMAV